VSLSQIFQRAYRASTSNKLKVTRAKKDTKQEKHKSICINNLKEEKKNNSDGVSKTKFHGGFLEGG
jgi:hypothetical protein